MPSRLTRSTPANSPQRPRDTAALARPEQPADERPSGWQPRANGGAAARRPSRPVSLPPSTITTPAAAPAAPVAAAAARAASPLDALKLVRSGDVELVIPVRPGAFDLGVAATARPDTVVRISAHVKDGVVDFTKTSLKFTPPLEVGPLSNDLSEVRLTKDGDVVVDLSWLPDPRLESRLPSRFADLVDVLASGRAMPVKVLGVTVDSVGGSRPGSPAPSGGAGVEPAAASPAGPRRSEPTLLEKLDTARATVSVKNVGFVDGLVPLGELGRVKVGRQSKLELTGTLEQLSLTAHAQFEQLDVAAGGTSVKGSAGTADLAVQWSGNVLGASGAVKASITNLTLATESAVSRRENGDFIELAQGSVQNGSLTLERGAGAAPRASIDLPRFRGTISRGQITVPDGDGTATIRLSRSTVAGSVQVDAGRVLVRGDVELNAELSDFQGPAGGPGVSIASAQLRGTSRVVFDSAAGLKADGSMRLQATLDDKAPTPAAGEQAVRLSAGSLDVTATRLEVGPGGALTVAARGQVDLGLERAEVGQKGVALQLGASRLAGQATLNIADGDVRLTNSSLRLSASVEDGTVKLGDNVSLDLQRGTSVQAALTGVAFGRSGTSMQFGPKTRLDAVLDTGTVRLPDGRALTFKRGASASFQFDRLVVPERGVPEAAGSIALEADLEANQVNLEELARLPGVSLSTAQGVSQRFKFSVGRFDIKRTGEFQVDDLAFSVEARIRRFGGVIR
jgi:hypothetical protein